MLTMHTGYSTATVIVKKENGDKVTETVSATRWGMLQKYLDSMPGSEDALVIISSPPELAPITRTHDVLYRS